MKRLLLFFLFFPIAVFAQGPSKTAIQDTVFGSDGGLANGTVRVTTAVGFTSNDGYYIALNTQALAQITNGALNLSLVPNTYDPSGNLLDYYTADFSLTSGNFREYWIVPAAASATHAAVVSTVLPQPGLLVNMNQVTPPRNCLSLGGIPQWTAFGWTCTTGGGGGGGPGLIQVNGVALQSLSPINFQNGTNISISNPSLGNIAIGITGLGASGLLEYNNAGSLTGISGWSTNGSSTLTGAGASVLDLSAMNQATGLKLPSTGASLPTLDTFFGFNTTIHSPVWGSNGNTIVPAAAAVGGGSTTTCSLHSWVSTLSATAAPGCTQPSYSDIAGTPTLFYQTLQNAGAAQTQRPIINIVPGSNITVTTVDNSGANRTDVTIAASSTVGAQWSSVGNPTTSTSLAMGNFPTLFTWGSATGSSDMFKLTDTPGNTATAALFHVTTAAGSSALPFQMDANGNGLKMTAAGLLTKIGTGGLDYGSLLNFPGACPSQQYAQAIGAALTCAQIAYSQISGTPTFQTNGVNNLSQANLNLVNSATANGLTIAFANTNAGVVQPVLTGTLNNSGLTNSSITVNTQPCVLGNSCTVSGGENTQTTSYTQSAADLGKLVVMNCAAACSFTFYATPTNGFYGAVLSVGSVTPTISLNGRTWNGSGSAPAFAGFQPLYFWSDGTNYLGGATLSVSAPLVLTAGSTGLTLTIVNATATAVGVIQLAGDLGGAATTPSVLKVDGVSYPANPATNTVPVVTSANTITYEAVPNSALANSSTTVNGQACALGASCTVNQVISVANANTGGTTANTLTKLTGAPSTAVIAALTDTGGIVGVTVSGAGTTGSATVQVAGLANCVFDGSTTAGDYVQISSSAQGNCHDAGGSYPTSNEVIGRVLSTNAAAGTYAIDLFPAEIRAGANGGGSGNVNNASQFSIAYYSASGTSNVISGLAPPTSPVGVSQFIVETPNGTGATQESFALAGVPINPQTGTSYQIAVTDRAGLITQNNSGASTYTAVNPSTAGFGSNFVYAIDNIGAGAVTEQASGFFLNGSASILIPPSWQAFHYSDNTNYRVSRFPDFTAFQNTPANTALTFNSATGIFGTLGSIVQGPVSSINGDLASFNGTSGLLLSDSGVPAASVTTNPTPGTVNAIPKWSAPNQLTNSSCSDNGTIFSCAESMDLQTNAQITEIPNSSSTGTTLNKLAKLTGAPSAAVIAASTDTSGIIGIVIGNAGTTGSAQVAIDGQASCAFDGGTTAGDFVSISGSVGGDCHDAGATRPSTGQVVGRVTTTNAAAGTYAVVLYGPDVVAGATGITIQTNGVNNSTQSALNLQNSAATNGVTVTVTNTSGGNAQLGLAGTLNNSGITNPSVTVNGITCTLGSSCNVGGGGASTASYPFTYPVRQEGIGFSIRSTTGVTVANTIAATSIIGSSGYGKKLIPAGAMADYAPGAKSFNIRATGTLGTAGTLPTLTLTVVLGGQTLSSISVPLLASLSSDGWTLEYSITPNSLTSAAVGGCIHVTGTSNAELISCASNPNVTSLNFASDQALDIQVTWGTASASNTITVNQMSGYPSHVL